MDILLLQEGRHQDKTLDGEIELNHAHKSRNNAGNKSTTEKGSSSM